MGDISTWEAKDWFPPDMQEKMLRVGDRDLHAAMLLMKYSTNSKPKYWAHCSPPSVIAKALKKHDLSVDKVMRELLDPGHSPEWSTARKIARLPISKGGLGILSLER
eukprot:5182902-Prorocentrum_lima.AAC.1